MQEFNKSIGGHNGSKKQVFGKTIFVNLFWSNNPAVPNFGDDINPFLFEELFRVNIKHVPGHFYKPHYIGIGSVLHYANKYSTILGTGFIQEEDHVRAPPHKIVAVRGKETRRKLLSSGIDCPEVYGDVALLFPKIYNPDITKKYKLGIIPHFIDKNISLKMEHGVLLIDIQNINHLDFINQGLSCEIIASSSLHGLIIADAYGIPTVWLEYSTNVIGNGFKFRDYFSSVGFDKKPLHVTASTSMQEILDACTPGTIQFDSDKLFNIINKQIHNAT